jgi:hypothetical protein
VQRRRLAYRVEAVWREQLEARVHVDWFVFFALFALFALFAFPDSHKKKEFIQEACTLWTGRTLVISLRQVVATILFESCKENRRKTQTRYRFQLQQESKTRTTK